MVSLNPWRYQGRFIQAGGLIHVPLGRSSLVQPLQKYQGVHIGDAVKAGRNL